MTIQYSRQSGLQCLSLPTAYPKVTKPWSCNFLKLFITEPFISEFCSLLIELRGKIKIWARIQYIFYYLIQAPKILWCQNVSNRLEFQEFVKSYFCGFPWEWRMENLSNTWRGLRSTREDFRPWNAMSEQVHVVSRLGTIAQMIRRFAKLLATQKSKFTRWPQVVGSRVKRDSFLLLYVIDISWHMRVWPI